MNIQVFELGQTGAFGQAEIQNQIKIVGKNQNIYAVRPHLYIEGNPSGSLLMRVQDTSGKIIKSSAAVAISTITSATYFHGFVRFVLELKLKKDTSYFFTLASSGYTYGASAFVGWCNSFDLGGMNPSYVNNSGVRAPLSMEIWSRDTIERGIA